MGSAVGPEWLEEVTVPVSSINVLTYGPPDVPAVIVVSEFWGINEDTKLSALKLHEKTGYRVLIPDLYHGKNSMEMIEATHEASELDISMAVKELNAIIKYLKEEGARKVAITGFCMGGMLAWVAACKCPVDCAIPFYGTPSVVTIAGVDCFVGAPEACDFSAIRVPIQHHNGDLDHVTGFSDAETVKACVAKAQAAGKDVELLMYEDTGHSFMAQWEHLVEVNKTRGFHFGSKMRETQELAWSRMEAFLTKHLGPAEDTAGEMSATQRILNHLGMS